MAVRLCTDKTVKKNRVALQQSVSFKKYVLNILLLSYATKMIYRFYMLLRLMTNLMESTAVKMRPVFKGYEH